MTLTVAITAAALALPEWATASVVIPTGDSKTGGKGNFGLFEFCGKLQLFGTTVPGSRCTAYKSGAAHFIKTCQILGILAGCCQLLAMIVFLALPTKAGMAIASFLLLCGLALQIACLSVFGSNISKMKAGKVGVKLKLGPSFYMTILSSVLNLLALGYVGRSLL
jgi:hypothetical protein